jgi:hypothetical protein
MPEMYEISHACMHEIASHFLFANQFVVVLSNACMWLPKTAFYAWLGNFILRKILVFKKSEYH